MTDAQAPDESVSADSAETEVQSCPNCGRTFKGNYCPQCGHKAGRELSTAEVIGGFFREFVDVERGFWATLKALTLHSGSSLQAYLRGAHERLMSPGRYLLAAVVLCYGVDRGLTWLGVRASLSSQAPTPPDDTPAVIREVQQIAWHVFEAQSARIVTNLLLAGFLALALWRLLGDELRRGAEALALGAFLVGHTVFLEAAIKLVYAPAVYLSTGQRAHLAYMLYLGLTTAYVGWVMYDWLDARWAPTAKGVLGLVWAFVDMASLLMILPLGYGLWLLLA
ncbi:MAG: DUF3667 domain-containing protein, partial [Salinibacter sp.]